MSDSTSENRISPDADGIQNNAARIEQQNTDPSEPENTANPPEIPMEVHHHSHGHGPKKWHQYFFEFFMLFLAVFCGFLAEYQLEHKIEADREIVYMKGMVEDLVTDTIELNKRLAMLDSVYYPTFDRSLELLYSGDISDSNVKKMYEIVPQSARFLEVHLEHRTKNQLVNSGNLRLVHSKQITDSLAIYWQFCDALQNPLLTGYAETRSKAKWAIHELFDFSNFEEYSPMKRLSDGSKPMLLAPEKTELVKLANHISNLRSQSKGPLKTSLLGIKARAIRIIELIKNQYNIH
ncbi:MAG: hypothetical protein JNM00_14050 [Flavobacteriales bacterium]|nr:hypothetical protein [Flavobacteriales bacterium]